MIPLKKFTGNVLLTKEAMVEHIKDVRIQQARECGVTYEEYMDSIMNGKTLIRQNPSSIVTEEKFCSKHDKAYKEECPRCLEESNK
jgi:hypothetical protein